MSLQTGASGVSALAVLGGDAISARDRIIPLGFLVADVASRALRSTPEVRITVSVVDIDEATIEVGLDADREISHGAPPRIFAGLIAQIEAVQTADPQSHSLGRWRVRHAV